MVFQNLYADQVVVQMRFSFDSKIYEPLTIFIELCRITYAHLRKSNFHSIYGVPNAFWCG